jgi:hypothetical protein
LAFCVWSLSDNFAPSPFFPPPPQFFPPPSQFFPLPSDEGCKYIQNMSWPSDRAFAFAMDNGQTAYVSPAPPHNLNGTMEREREREREGGGSPAGKREEVGLVIVR